ncbi:lectin FIP-fve [Gelatoporia subvermispora B]|uniref:Lectin FIP-fve n=1 Tax=Ceriporiopsis subvermispora (strain B) TaxID=914234 RepID=M2PWI3_CERS8|nr:lectin FIP-fve [Gelatoporia subvermispora B]
MALINYSPTGKSRDEYLGLPWAPAADGPVGTSRFGTLNARTPTIWKRGNPTDYVDHVTLPRVPADKIYQCRVMKSNLDLGIQPTHPLNEDGSQTINLTEYNKRYGIHDTQNIKVYVIDPADNTEKPVAKWEAPLKSLNSSHENRRGFLTFGTYYIVRICDPNLLSDCD